MANRNLYAVNPSYLFLFSAQYYWAWECAVPNNALKEHELTQPLTSLLTFPVVLGEGKFA